MHAPKSSNGPRTDGLRRPLMQVEVLLLFHRRLQGGCARKASAQECADAAHGWLTLDVYGRRGVSELSGAPVMEDLRLEVGGEDIEALLPDGIVNEVADYVMDEA